MSGTAKIAVIDDHPLYRAGIREAVAGARDLTIVAEGANASDAMTIASAGNADLMLLDLSMPGGGIAAARQILESCPGIKVVFLTNSESESTVSEGMRLGVHGYIVKGVGGPELMSILRLVQKGEGYVTPNLAAEVLRNRMRVTGERSRE